MLEMKNRKTETERKKVRMKRRGISPIIGFVFIFAILISTYALFVVWRVSTEQMEIQRQKERLQQEAEKGSESLFFFNRTNPLDLNSIGLLNNGSVMSTVLYVKVDDLYIDSSHTPPLEFYSEDGAPVQSQILPNESMYIHVNDYTGGWTSLTIGTRLGNQFVYNKPSAIIVKFESTGEDLVFYGDAATQGSTIVAWEWDWSYVVGNFTADGYGKNPTASLTVGTHVIALRVTDTTGNWSITSLPIEVTELDVRAQVTPIVALEDVGNTGGTYGRWWIFRFRKGCDQVSIPLQNISSEIISLTDMKIFWHEMQQADPCVSDLCPARLASIRVYRQYKPGGVWNGEWVLVKSSEPTTWNPNFDPDPSTPAQENFPGGVAILGKYRFMDPERLWTQCFWGFYETQNCDCLDCEATAPDYIGFNISGELVSFVNPSDPNEQDLLTIDPGEIIVVTLRFCAGNRCGDDLTMKLYDPDEVYTVTVHVPLDVQVGPRDGSIEQTSTITFRWRELFNYESWLIFGRCVHEDSYFYWLQISEDPEFPAGNRIDVTGGTGTFDFTEVALVKYTRNLELNKSYYWRVNGSKDYGAHWSGWSRVWHFCTGSCPAGQTSYLTDSSAFGSSALYILCPFVLIFVAKRLIR